MVVRRYTSDGVAYDVEAIRFDGWNWMECHQFVSDDLLVFPPYIDSKYREAIVITIPKENNLTDSIVVEVGDYITSSIETGEMSVYREEAFNNIYKKYEEEL